MRWSWLLLVVAFGVLAGTAWGQGNTCTCPCPPDEVCPGNCATCTFEPSSCDCRTPCTGSPSCSPGYSVAGVGQVCTRPFASRLCRLACVQGTQTCATCPPGRYGLSCQNSCLPSASNPCSGKGTCSTGPSGNGACTCDLGYAGSYCQYSSAVDCNGNGVVSSTGSCSCNEGYTGTRCNSCATNYWAYPTCKRCLASDTCNAKGVCNELGNCVCNIGYSGPNCAQCDVSLTGGYSAYPECKFCLASYTCNNRGTCPTTPGNYDCICNTGWATSPPPPPPALPSDKQCDICAPGYFGPSCRACPAMTADGPCNGHGECDDGLYGSGQCFCHGGYAGQFCEYSDAITCKGRGRARSDGTCLCWDRYAGANCDICAVNYWKYPTCRFCGPDSCSGQGTCITTETPEDPEGKLIGYCTCNDVKFHQRRPADEYARDCATCRENYYNYPVCVYCTAQETCGGYGTCGPRGTCVCGGYNTGSDCLSCPSGYYGLPCRHCPHTANPPCSGPTYGFCFDGAQGNGTCRCYPPYHGTGCSAPVIHSITPTTWPTAGLVLVTVIGQFMHHADNIYQIAGPPGAVETVRAMTIQFGRSADVVIQPTQMQPSEGGIGILRLQGWGGTREIGYRFTPPAVTSVFPTNGPTRGGTRITLTGISFGRIRTVEWDGAQIPIEPAALETTHTQIELMTPPGSGRDIPIVVKVAGQASAVFRGFSYDRPTVTRVEPPNGPTAGSPVVITGNNLGNSIDRMAVTVAGRPCTVTSVEHTQIVCTTPPGRDTGQPMEVDIRGQKVMTTFNYDPPILNGVEGCPAQHGAWAAECDPKGGTRITVVGSNFGDQLDNPAMPETTNEIAYPDLVTGWNRADSKDFALNDICLPQEIIDTGITNGCSMSGANVVRFSDANSDGAGEWRMEGDHAAQLAGLQYTLSLYVKTDSPSPVTVNFITGTDGQVGRVDGNPGKTVTAAQGWVRLTWTYWNPPGSQARSVHFSYLGLGAYRMWWAAPQLENQPSATPFWLGTRQSGVTYPGTGTETSLSITVTGKECTDKQYVEDHFKISCRLPSGYGRNQTVTVSRRGAYMRNGRLLSYAGPIIDTGSLRKFGSSPVIVGGVAAISYTTTTASEWIAFTGRNFGTNVSEVTVYYGPVHDPWQYTCSAVRALTDTYLEARIVGGVGKNLRFSLITQGVPSTQGADTLTFPAPLYVEKSLARVGEPGTDHFITDTNAGDLIEMRGLHFGTDIGDISVTYGPEGDLSRYTCYVTSNSSNDRVVCTTQQGEGIDLFFRITIGRELSAQSVVSTDRYSYPTPPTVTLVSGCRDRFDSGLNFTITEDCPTDAKHPNGNPILLTITGTAFGNGTLVFVGGKPCSAVTPWPGMETVKLTCRLPSGVGFRRDVSIQVGRLYSAAYPAVSYSIPTLTSIRGCTGNGNRTINCDRAGGKRITLTGTNFGESNALVMIGGELCANVIHNSSDPHRSLWCTYPSGVGLDRAILLVQPQGEMTPRPLYLDFQQCGPGTYIDKLLCPQCPPGKFTNVQGSEQCLDCPIGQFAENPGSTVCRQCMSGYYAGTQASSRCRGCAAGKFALNPGAAVCLDCPVGTYQPLNFSQECIQATPGYYVDRPGAIQRKACAPGSFTAFNGESACTLCQGGSYAAFEASTECIRCPKGNVTNLFDGQGSTGCVPCGPGRYSENDGEANCRICPIGRYAARATGNSVCLECELGRFSDQAGAATCKVCPAGKIAATPGLAECEDCAVGSVAPTNTSSNCTVCPLGSYQMERGQTVCLRCLPGTYINLVGQALCERCPVGEYSNTTGSIGCMPCPAGTFATLGSQPGSSSCTPCQVGRYSNTERMAECTACEAGRYAGSPGSPSCVPCPVGTSTNSRSGMSVCQSCQRGTYAEVEGQLECDLCPVGRFAGSAGQTECGGCEAGTFGADEGQTACNPCSRGSFNNLREQPRCLPCIPGTFANASGSAECGLCPAGQFSSGGAVACIPCPGGSFALSEGTAQCTQCQLGRAQAIPGSTACLACTAGRYADRVGQANCLACETGRYVNTEGQSQCYPCPEGTAVNVTGAATCNPCQPGTHAPFTGRSTCTACSAGRYNQFLRQRLCIDCPPGTYGREEGKTSCISCSPGSYQNRPAQSSCVPCFYGTATNLLGSSSCPSCNLGRFANDTGMNMCIPCLRGTYSPSPGAVECLLCDPGTDAPGLGSARCTVCQPGFASSEFGQPTCDACPTGRYNDLIGGSVCRDCAAGRSAPTPSTSTCAPCAAGSYANTTGLADCADCPLGKFQSTTGQSECVDCAAGEFSGATKQSVCGVCTPGRFASRPGQSICEECAPGKYSDAAGSTTCAQCPVGHVTTVAGQSACRACSPGSFANATGMFACTLCPAGWSQPISGATVCAQCATGRATAATGQANCPDCLAGTYNDKEGATECASCAVGRYQDRPGRTECPVCAAGSAAGQPGSPVCDPCRPGLFGNQTAMTVCDQCVAGRFTPTAGLTVCGICEPGKFAATGGSSLCANCEAGKYNIERESTVCFLCDAGYFQDQEGSTTCSPCAIGKTAESPGTRTCFTCEAGTISNRTANSQPCELCRRGQNQPNPGSSSCEDCLPGRYAGSFGKAECDLCDAGTIANRTAAEICDSCPQGFYQDRRGAIECFICPMGKFASNAGTAECAECPAGEYQTREGQAICDPCPAGSFQRITGRTYCEACREGTFAESTGRSECELCGPGRYINATGAETCIDCLLGQYQDGFGSLSCLPCESNTYSNTGGSSKCSTCDVGTVQPETGKTTCVACPRGYYKEIPEEKVCRECLPGWFARATGQSICEQCAPGSVQPNKSATTCIDCTPGYYQNLPAQTECGACIAGRAAPAFRATSCDNCVAGRYTVERGTPECMACPPGRFQDKPSAVDCKPCLPGSYSNDVEGADECLPCRNQAAPFGAMSACMSCDTQGAPNAELTTCVCRKEWFLEPLRDIRKRYLAKNNPGDYESRNETEEAMADLSQEELDDLRNDTFIHCRSCPLGAVCKESGVTFENMHTEEGFWRNCVESLSFYRCLLPDHCVGGRNETCQEGDASTCGPNRMGRLCAECMPGYVSSTGFSECKPCPQQGMALTQSVIFIFLIVCAVVLLYYIVIRSDKDLHDEMKRRDNEEDFYELNGEDAAKKALSKRTRHAPNFTFKLKIIIGFMQIGTNLAFVSSVPWPKYYLDFIRVFDFVNFEFVPWTSVGCVTTMNFIAKLYIVTLTPLFVFFVLAVLYLGPARWYVRRDMSDDQLATKAVKRLSKQFWKLILFTVFLIYPSLSSKVLGYFVCREVDGVNYLVGDFTIHCGDPEWMKHLPLGIVMTLVYPFGIPLLFFWALYRKRDRLTEPDVVAKIGFLYQAYEFHAWWFELADIINKLTLTSLIVFLPESIRMPAGMLWIICYIIVILITRPYLRQDDDMLLLLSTIEIYLLILCGYILTDLGGKQLEDSVDLAMSVVLIALTILMVLLTVVLAGWNLRKIWRQWQRKSKDEADTRQRVEEETELRDKITGFVNPLLQQEGLNPLAEGVATEQAAETGSPSATEGGIAGPAVELEMTEAPKAVEGGAGGHRRGRSIAQERLQELLDD